MPIGVSTEVAAAVLRRAPALVELIVELIRENDLTPHGRSMTEIPAKPTLENFVLVGSWSCGCRAAKIRAEDPREVLELVQQLRESADVLEARALALLAGAPQPGAELEH